MSEPLDLGDQPDDWTRCRLKDVTTWVNRGMAPIYADAETGVLAFSQKCVRPDLSVDPDLGRPIEPEDVQLNAPARLRPGDVVVNSTGRGTLGRAALVRQLPQETLIADGHVTVVRVTEERLSPRFLAYLLGAQAFYEQANACLAIGSTNQTELGREVLRRIRLSLPPAEAQQRIADYLDAETARIDALVDELAITKALISEQSMEHQASVALGGVPPEGTYPLSDPWIRGVPSHWRLARLKYEARLESGHTPSRSKPELWQDCTIPWVSLNDVTAMASIEFIESTVNLISEAGLAASSARVLPAGTVVLSRDATIGRTAILARPMATSQHFADWICGPKLLPRYLWLLFRTAMKPHFDSLTDGATLRTIGMPDMRQLVVPVPPIEEQLQIVAEAESVRGHEAVTRSELDTQTDLLRERRQALITHAVTHGIEALPGVA